jgi:hypothetical protein
VRAGNGTDLIVELSSAITPPGMRKKGWQIGAAHAQRRGQLACGGRVHRAAQPSLKVAHGPFADAGLLGQLGLRQTRCDAQLPYLGAETGCCCAQPSAHLTSDRSFATTTG